MMDVLLKQGRQCRVCGCTDITACTHEDGSPCALVDDDLCTVCDERRPVVRDKLLAAASNLAAAAEGCIESGRAPERFMHDLMIATDGVTPLVLDALRLILEASGSTDDALYTVVVKELSP
jgi:hypothetical protein